MEKLEKIQSDIYEIKVRNNLDRYGLSYVLADKWGKIYTPRAFCDWIHGWYWWQKDLSYSDIIYDISKHRKSNYIIVSNENEKNILNEVGLERVVTAGLPIIYAKSDIEKPRKPNTLLAFVEHSSESIRDKHFLDKNFLDYLETEKKNYELIAVSIYSLDYTSEVKNEIIRRGLVPLMGANPTDKNTFKRISEYFSFFSNVTGNVMGSYIAYAHYFGNKVYLPGNFYKRDFSIFKKENYSDEYISRMEYFSSESYSRMNYPHLFQENFNINSEEIMEIGKGYVGEIYKMDPRSLQKYLGWDLLTQIREYSIGGINRVKRILFN